MAKPYRICFLGYGHLTDMGRMVVSKLDWPDTEILVADCNVDSLIECVNAAIAKGYEIFIGGSANAAEFFRRAEGHLVEIRTRDADYLLAIQKALLLGKRPTIAVYRHSRLPNMVLYRQLLGVELELLVYEDGLELYTKIEHSDGDVVIGASHSNEVAAALGKQSVLLYPGEESIAETFRQARAAAIELRKEQQNQAITRSVLNNSTFGIVVSNGQNRIIMFNRSAQRLTGIAGVDARGGLMSDIFPMLGTEKFLADVPHQKDAYHLVRDAMLRCTQTKISVQNENIGVLTTLNTDTRSRRYKGAIVPLAHTATVDFQDLVTDSPIMRQLAGDAALYADSSASVLLVGPEFTGREQLAQCIHNSSPCRNGPYVRVNAAALGSHDAGRFLLGCEERERTTVGLLEMANNGSVVLEHLADASPQAIRCILDVLSTRRVMRLGKLDPISVDIRFLVIATQEEVDRLPVGLRYKLGVFCLTVPPLCQRREDIPALFGRLLSKQAEAEGKRGVVTDQMLEVLGFYHWPGNFGEMSAVCERYLQLINHAVRPNQAGKYRCLIEAIGEEPLFESILSRFPALTDKDCTERNAFREGVDAIKSILGYNNAVIAEKLGISRTTLWRILKEQEQA